MFELFTEPSQYERLSTVHTIELYNPHKVPENWFERYAEQKTFDDCCRGYEGFEAESWIKSPANENKKLRLLNENKKLHRVKLPQPGNEACAFLEKLRPAGPWVLTAIDPDNGKIITSTARTKGEVETFIQKYNGKRGLYYSVNPTRTAMSTKAKKTDIAAIEYALADLDPADGETSDAAKQRYLKQLNGRFEPKPTAVVDSGNGIQCLWRLQERIELGEPVNGKFSPKDQAKIDDVEERIEAVMLRLGSKAGTQNIDRILRLPGTTNLPNKKKRDAGRVACPTKFLWFDAGASYPLDAFPKEEAKQVTEASATKQNESGEDSARRNIKN